MADVVRAFLLVAALVASIRAYYTRGIVLTVGCLGLVVIEVALPFLFPLDVASVEIALGAVFLGPSAMPHRPPFALTAILIDPSHHVLMGIVSGLGARGAFVRASSLSPESEPARRLDRAGLRFVALAVLAGMLAVAGFLVHATAGEP